MFEISEQLILEQSDEIFGVSQVSWESSPCKQLSLVNDEEVSHQSLACNGLCILRFRVMFGKDESEPNIKYCLERQLLWFKNSSQYRTLDTIDGEPMEFEWNISQDSLHWSLSMKSKSS